MTNKIAELPFPPHWVNQYIHQKLTDYGVMVDSRSGGVVPIFAVTPTNTEEIYKNLLQSVPVEQPLLIQYDRLMRFRPSPMYATKREQVIYYLYSTDIATVNNANILISQLLDREDAAAQDLNAYSAANPITRGGQTINCNVFFHNVKVYQADETRDVLELASARTVYINKIIVEYDYHSNWGIGEDSQEQFK